MDYMMGRNGFYGRKNFMDYMVSKIIRIIWWVGLYGLYGTDYINYMVSRIIWIIWWIELYGRSCE